MKTRTLAARSLFACLCLSLPAGFMVPGCTVYPQAAPSVVSGHSVQAATRVAYIGMTVSDLDRSVRFYTEVLGFTRVSADAEAFGDEVEARTGVFGARTRTARLALGSEQIELTEYLAPEGRPIPPGSKSNDGWFQHIAIVVSDIDQAYAKLRDHKVRHASTGPQTLPAWNVNAAGISAFYFKDPDGHVLEVIHFPKGKGDPRWQSTPGLFLGIDHTAIVTRDTEASIRFYRDQLGLRVAGGSENSGIEQDHLNNVKGAHLRITTLRAPQGPGVELLEYISPGLGRPMPADTASNDLWHWHTAIEMPGVEGHLVTDPDRHAVLLVGK